MTALKAACGFGSQLRLLIGHWLAKRVGFAPATAISPAVALNGGHESLETLVGDFRIMLGVPKKRTSKRLPFFKKSVKQFSSIAKMLLKINEKIGPLFLGDDIIHLSMYSKSVKYSQ
jgi:hypothetical protein